MFCLLRIRRIFGAWPEEAKVRPLMADGSRFMVFFGGFHFNAIPPWTGCGLAMKKEQCLGPKQLSNATLHSHAGWPEWFTAELFPCGQAGASTQPEASALPAETGSAPPRDPTSRLSELAVAPLFVVVSGFFVLPAIFALLHLLIRVDANAQPAVFLVEHHCVFLVHVFRELDWSLPRFRLFFGNVLKFKRK